MPARLYGDSEWKSGKAARVRKGEVAGRKKGTGRSRKTKSALTLLERREFGRW